MPEASCGVEARTIPQLIPGPKEEHPVQAAFAQKAARNRKAQQRRITGHSLAKKRCNANVTNREGGETPPKPAGGTPALRRKWLSFQRILLESAGFCYGRVRN